MIEQTIRTWALSEYARSVRGRSTVSGSELGFWDIQILYKGLYRDLVLDPGVDLPNPEDPELHPLDPNVPLSRRLTMMAKPSAPKHMTESAKSARFFWATLMEFLERTRPDSTIMKPICIRKIMAAAVMIQTWSRLA